MIIFDAPQARWRESFDAHAAEQGGEFAILNAEPIDTLEMLYR